MSFLFGLQHQTTHQRIKDQTIPQTAACLLLALAERAVTGVAMGEIRKACKSRVKPGTFAQVAVALATDKKNDYKKQ